jgi:hypothetical protein
VKIPTVVAGPVEQAEPPEKTLAVAIRTGSGIAHRDLEEETGVPDSSLEEVQDPALENLVGVAAKNASTYAEKVGHF